MPSLRISQLVPHARSTAPRATSVLALALMTAAIATDAHAQSRGRSGGNAGTAMRSAHAQPAPPGRYRGFGQVRGGSGAPPVRQPNLSHALSGLGTVQHIERSRRFHPPVHLPHHVVHHPRPRVIYVPVAYAVPTPQPDPIIVVQQAPAPPARPVVVTVGAPGAGSASAPPIPPPPPAPPRPTSTEPGTLRFAVFPADAEVVLDDQRLGTPAAWPASERPVAPGIHVVEVTHPAHVTERVVFAVEPGGDRGITIDLREERASRRTRID